MMIVGVFDIYFKDTNKVDGIAITGASDRKPIQRFDINKSDLQGHHYWLLNTKKLIDGDVKAKIVNQKTQKGQISSYYWTCKDYF